MLRSWAGSRRSTSRRWCGARTSRARLRAPGRGRILRRQQDPRISREESQRPGPGDRDDGFVLYESNAIVRTSPGAIPAARPLARRAAPGADGPLDGMQSTSFTRRCATSSGSSSARRREARRRGDRGPRARNAKSSPASSTRTGAPPLSRRPRLQHRRHCGRVRDAPVAQPAGRARAEAEPRALVRRAQVEAGLAPGDLAGDLLEARSSHARCSTAASGAT